MPLTQPVPLLRQDDDGTALGRLVGQRRQLGGVGEFGLRRTAHRHELRRLPVAERDRAGLVEQQARHIAGRLDGPARHGQDVALHQPVHARDADRGEQGADRGRDQADQESHQHDHAQVGARVVRERRQGGHREQEDDGQRGEQDVQGDLVGRLLPCGALDQADHAVDEGLARLRRDPDDDAVGEDLRAAGDRRPVTAGLADDGGRLAGDRRLVDGGHALDDVTVAGDDVARLADDVVADTQLGTGHLLLGLPHESACHGVGLGLAQGVRLGLAPALGDRLRQIGEDHGEPEPGADRPAEPVARVLEGEHRRQHRADQDHEHHR
ncbi:hypothetical protein RKD18_001081 [Streptomyces phaeoluteigriseus]